MALAAISLVSSVELQPLLLTTNTTPDHAILTDGKDINDVISNSSGLEHRPVTRAQSAKVGFLYNFLGY